MKPYSQASALCDTVSMMIEDSLKKSKKGLSAMDGSSFLQKKNRHEKHSKPAIVMSLDVINGI